MNDHFCGWYYKCQSAGQTLAVIPAIHRTSGVTTCSIQLLTEAASWSVPFPPSAGFPFWSAATACSVCATA